MRQRNCLVIARLAFVAMHAFNAASARGVGIAVSSVLFAATGAIAQDSAEPVRLLPPEGPVYVGESFTLRLMSTVGEIESLDALPSTPGLRLERGMTSSSQSVQIISGQRVARSEHAIDLIASASRTGAITIPPLTLRVGGSARTTQPVTIEVIEPEAASGFPLRLTLAANQAFVGQTVEGELRWRVDAQPRNWRFLGLSGPFDVILERDTSNASGRAIGVDLDGRQAVARIEQRGATDAAPPEVVVPFQVVPRAPGEMTLERVSVVFDEIVGEDRSGGSLFGPRYLTERRISEAPPVRLTVRALPESNRPNDFSGIVGDCVLDATLSPRTVSVGDPLTLSLRLRSNAPLAAVAPPDLGAIPGVDEAFKLDTRGWEEQESPDADQRVWTTTIRARSAETDALPPISLAFFNPASGTYERASTEAIPIEVRDVRRVTLDDASVSSGSPARPSLTSLPPDPPTLARTIGPVARPPTPGEDSSSITVAIVLGATGATVVLSAWAAGSLVARRAPEAARRRAHRNAAIRGARRGPLTPERVRDALASACCALPDAWTTDDPRSITIEEASGRLSAQLNEADGALIRTLARYASESQFAPHARGPGEPPASNAEFVQLLRRALSARAPRTTSGGAL